MSENWDFITAPSTSFAGVPIHTDLDTLQADIAVIGLHFVSPYPFQKKSTPPENTALTAPDTIRDKSSIFIDHLDHYDFNLGGPLLADNTIRIVDCGDVDKQCRNTKANSEFITKTIDTLLKKGAFPVAIGTDEGGFIPFVRAYHEYKNLCVIHMDAHIDWRDEKNGVREGYSSVMRRTSEMDWVTGMAQIGLRGMGSARKKEVDDARAFGSVFIRARDIHEKGIHECLKHIPSADGYIITIDSDVFDTGMAPGVLFPTPDGLTFYETTDLVDEISHLGPIRGICLFEVRPELDINNMTSSTAAQLLIHFIGSLVKRGHITGSTS